MPQTPGRSDSSRHWGCLMLAPSGQIEGAMNKIDYDERQHVVYAAGRRL